MFDARAAGRAEVRPPRPEVATPRENQRADSAQTLRQRQLMRFADRLAELHVQLTRLASAGPGALPHRARQTWENAKRQLNASLLRNDEGFDSLRRAEDMPTLAVITDALASARAAAAHQERLVRYERIAVWKKRMQECFDSAPRAIFRWCAGTAHQTVTSVARADGSITANVAEMDEIVGRAWAPIFRKFTDENPEPPWGDFKDRFRDNIARHPLDLAPLTAEQLQATLSRMSGQQAGGLDGWRPKELKSCPHCSSNSPRTSSTPSRTRGAGRRWPSTPSSCSSRKGAAAAPWNSVPFPS